MYIIYNYTELEDSDLHETLQQLNANNKELNTAEKYLTEENLIPLMEMQESDAMPYYQFINEQLLKMTDTKSILELLDVGDRTEEDSATATSAQVTTVR